MKNLLITILLISTVAFSCKNETTTNTSSAAGETSVSSYTNMDVAAFQQKIKEGKVVIMDVRTAEEYAAGHIDGAINFDVKSPSFASNITKMNEDTEYMVYCKAGGRSVKACKIMAKAGLKNLYNLEGGFDAWSAQN